MPSLALACFPPPSLTLSLSLAIHHKLCSKLCDSESTGLDHCPDGPHLGSKSRPTAAGEIRIRRHARLDNYRLEVTAKRASRPNLDRAIRTTSHCSDRVDRVSCVTIEHPNFCARRPTLLVSIITTLATTRDCRWPCPRHSTAALQARQPPVAAIIAHVSHYG